MGDRDNETSGVADHNEESETIELTEGDPAATNTAEANQRPNFADDGWEEKSKQWGLGKYNLPRYYKLETEENARRNSMHAVNFIIFVSAVNTKMLNPNFAIMCTPGAHEDSFDNTNPFEFNSATYFLPLTTLIGVAMSSVFIGSLSDRSGRKRVMLILAWISAVGSIAKYFTRNTYWGFCASNFAFGFFLGNLPVGMAYIGDVGTAKKEKDEMLGVLVGCFVMGNSGGGIIAVLMNDAGLFSPLLVGAGMMVIAAIVTHIYMIEPGDARLEQIAGGIGPIESYGEEDDNKRPETIDKKTMWNIVIGALLDNIGSTGLFPLCLSPLALEQYYIDFVNKGEEPIMTITAYQWLSVCVALLVVPSTQMTPFVFKKLGVAGTCVFGNLCTAVVTGLLLWIGNLAATDLAFGMFVFVMYAGFPFTVFSQLTTGPMLDVIAPQDKIGFVQGLNNSSMNFGMALAPWGFGLLADATTTNIAILTGIAFSILAALVNAILMWHPQMARQKPKPPVTKRRLLHEDEEMVQMILDGEIVDPEVIFNINLDRGAHGTPALLPRVKPYCEEKDNLEDLAKHAEAAFKFRMELHDRVLANLSCTESDPENCQYTKEELCRILNNYKGDDQNLIDKTNSDLGCWMGEYLYDNGYNPENTSMMIKLMFMSSFPPLTRAKEFTPENIEEWLVKGRKVMSRYAAHEPDEYSLTGVLGKSPVVFYS